MSEDRKDDLFARAQALPRTLEAGRDLWPGIERVIRRSENPLIAGNRTMSLCLVALLFLGIAIGIRYLTVGVESGPVDTGFYAHYAVDSNVLQVQHDLVSRLDQQLSQLSPEARQILLENLLKIDNAIHEINRALAEEPNNELLLEMLLSTYTDELQMLGEMDSLTQTLNQRTRI